jgi:hypothetical protein
MDLRLGNKLALVTGSTGGIGEGIAKSARKGRRRRGRARQERGAGTARCGGDRWRGPKVFVATGDLSTDEGAGQVAHRVLSVAGGVDILINNAGARLRGSAEVMDRGTGVRVAAQGLATLQGLRAEGADQRDAHRGGDDPAHTTTSSESGVNPSEYALRTLEEGAARRRLDRVGMVRPRNDRHANE